MNVSWKARLDAVRRRLEDHEACVLYPGPNLHYVSGFYGEPRDRHLFLLVAGDGDTAFVTPAKSVGQLDAGSELDVDERIVVSENSANAIADGLQEAISPQSSKLLLDEHMPFAIAHTITETVPDRTFDSTEAVFTTLRLRKDDAEIAALRHSAAVADAVSEEIRSFGTDAVGMTESAIADEIRGRLHLKGGTRLSFDVVVASGPNGADPFYRHGDRTIREGDPVVLDFGTYVDQYASDQTRTVVFAGSPPEEFESAYDAVVASLDAGVDAAEPGVALADVDRVVRDVIAEHGFEDPIRHGTGHGIGLEAHEAPTVGSDSDRTIRPGFVFSIEPGVYLPDEFGVRVEDIVVVTNDGADRLNASPRTWTPLTTTHD